MTEELSPACERNRLILTVPAASAGRKLINLLRTVPGLSHARIGSLKYDPEGILLNGVRVPVSVPVREGDRISVLLDDSENRAPHLLPNPLPLDILYEDRNLLILNKPSGQVCHPSKGHLTDSLANGVLSYLQDREPRAAVHFAGRLDRDTSGIVAVAKNGITAERLTLLKASGHFEKTYIAAASGHFSPREGIIDLRMEEYRTEDNVLKIRRAPDGAGMPALTRFRVLGESGAYSVLGLTLDTGRMHQIRFHMAETGHPLLGDPLYGAGARTEIGRTALHARQLRFTHPYTGEELILTAPLPGDMRPLIQSSVTSPDPLIGISSPR